MSETRSGRGHTHTVAPELPELAGSMLPTMSRMLWVLRSGRSIDLPHHSIRLLNRLRAESVTMTQAAEEMQLSKPATSAAVSRMEEIGLVRRERNEADGRSTLLRLTRSGGAVARDLHSGVIDRLVRLLAELDPEDVAALSRGFTALNDALFDADPKRGPA